MWKLVEKYILIWYAVTWRIESWGNKDDDPDRKVVLSEDAHRYARQMGIQLFEASAMNNTNVEESFRAIAELALRTKREQQAQMGKGKVQER